MMPRISPIARLFFYFTLLIAVSVLSPKVQAQDFQFNGSATNNGGIQLTDGNPFEAGSAFTTARQPIQNFSVDFNFQLTNANADGFAFVVQSNGPNALGSNGGGIGYGNPPGGTGPSIPNSVAVVFDLHNNQGEGNNSVRVESGGVTVGTGAVDISECGIYDPGSNFPNIKGIDLHSGRQFNVFLAYGEGSFFMQIYDFNADKECTVNFNNVYFSKLVGSGEAYLGFTGSTGAQTAIQTIGNFSYTNNGGYLSDGGGPVGYPAPSYPSPTGFTGATGLQLNGGALISGSNLQLTHGTQFEATSAYFNQKLPLHDVNSTSDDFYTDFDFQIANGQGDGFTFVLQDDKLTAVGPTGGGLGYGPYVYIQPPPVSNGGDTCISESSGGPALAPPCPGGGIQHSVAVKFDVHNNQGEGANSTGFYFNGLSPTIPAIDFGTSGINLQSGHNFHATIGTVGTPGNSDLKLTITDLDNFKVFTTTQHIPAGTASNPFSLLPANAWAGFTAGTGATPSNITIKNWTWSFR